MHVGIDAHLLNRSSGYRAAGISRHSQNLLEGLRQAGRHRYTAFVAPAGAPDPAAPRDPAFRYVVSRLPTERPAARILWEQAVGPLEAARRRLDVLHGLAYAVPLAAPCPTVVTVHDLSFVRFPELFRAPNRLYLTASTRAAVRRSRRVIAVSESTKRELVELLGVPPDKITAIPNGVEPSFAPAEPAAVEAFRRAKGLPERFLLHLGTLEPRKNLPALVRAYARLRRDHGVPHALMLAGGKGWHYDAVFAEIERLGLGSHVFLPGYVPFAEQPLWYSAAEVFVYPALYEGFGMPPLEAMACGVPVITSNTSSLPEAVGDAGLQVDPHDEAALAEAMWRVIDDADLRSSMRAAGLARARQFDWVDIARRTVEVYEAAA
jgi:glycosyltransferase involved in cell wall biosynthesis